MNDALANWQNLLAKLLDPLESKSGLRAGIAEELRAYLLLGDNPWILQEIHQYPAVAQRLTLISPNQSASGLWKLEFAGLLERLYADFERLPEALALRWAKLLEASLVAHPQTTFSFAIPGNIRWPEALLMNSAGCSLNELNKTPRSKISLEFFERLLLAGELPASSLIVSAFVGNHQRLLMIGHMPGYSEALCRHAKALGQHLSPSQLGQRLHVLEMLALAEAKAIACFAKEVVALATLSTKQVQIAAKPLLEKAPEAMLAPLKTMAQEGKLEQRLIALRSLWRFASLCTDAAALQDLARAIAKADKAEAVRGLLVEWGPQSLEKPAEDFTQPYPQIHWAVEISAQASAALNELWEKLNQAIRQENQARQSNYERCLAAGKKAKLQLLKPYTSAEQEQLRAFICSPNTRLPQKLHAWIGAPEVESAILRFATDPAVPLVMAVKTLAMLRAYDGFGLRYQETNIFEAIQAAHGRLTLLEVQALIEPFQVGPEEILGAYCRSWAPFAYHWPEAAVWPFFAHNQALLVKKFFLEGDYRFDRKLLFKALSKLPRTPDALVNPLFARALGTAKTERLLAQQALRLPNKEERIIQALSDGKADVRAIAAEWLGRLQASQAIPALEAALAKEKQDVVKGALLNALLSLGRPVEQYLSRQELLSNAQKTLAKALPKELAQFPWAALPAVRWADTGEAVHEDVLRWLLVQAVKQKSPEPNALLRLYCGMFQAQDREVFGQFVLEAWLHEDTRPMSMEEAQRAALDAAQRTYNLMQRYPQHYQADPNYGCSLEELAARCLPNYLTQAVGNALAIKGLLAIAAVCARQRAAAPVQRYLKTHYGTRAVQGKALIAMLAWIEHPTATQLMLSVSSRFRTKSFQEEASRQAAALAERKGWTLDELADRSIPSGGFDEQGHLELSYGGTRSFTARLLADFKIELFNDSGKKIATLPEPRQDEDAEQAKEAKKAFSAAKKEIKDAQKLQSERLYEALCTERDWPFADWDLYLNRHPLMRQLLQRLVWVEVEDQHGKLQVRQIFRPLDDGSLTDADDNPVKLSAQARVRLAHDTLLTAEQITQWQNHLQDYAIAPLFQQLGKGTYLLPAEQTYDPVITDFEGHLLEAFALRSRAQRLGYNRSNSEDAGWFYSYEKRFPTLGISACIGFTGNFLPEENRTVALLDLSFEDLRNEKTMSLGRVPKILLSECYNDMRLMAAEGTGFDPQWEEKGY